MPIVRDATERDLADIFAIYDHEVLHGVATCDTQPRSVPEREAWFATHDPRAYPLIVAEDAGRIAGWGCLSPWSPRPAYARTCEDTVYVAPDAQGRGIGRALLAELVARARRAERGLVVARVVEGNPASLRLHESAGFETIGVMRRVAEKHGRLLDVRILGLALDAARGG
jgi:phosphinothricin acetyltransferase